MPSESARGACVRTNGELAVLLEFSASGPAQNLSAALADALSMPTLDIDLIDIGYGRETDLDRRAASIAEDVVAAGAARVAVVASCTAGSALAPVVGRLRQHGIRVDLAAAVDPGPVTGGHIRYTLGQIAAGLGIQDGVNTARHVDLTGPAPSALDRIGAVLGEWVERFLVTSGMDEMERDIMRNDLLDRYVRWGSFLLAALDAPACDPACRLETFSTGPTGDLAAMFGPAASIRQHRYHDGEQGLGNADLVADLLGAIGTALAA